MNAPVKKCEVCHGTGHTGGDGYHDYLDCTHCDAATERAALNKAIFSDRKDIRLDDQLWRAYQLGKAAAQPKEDIERPTDYDIIMMACEIALQDDVWEINDADLIPFVRRCIAAAAPVVPVAAQPVVQQEPVAWLVYAEDHDGMVPQFPAYQVKLQADRYAAMYGQTPTEVRPLYAAPSLEAQPAGEVASAPNAALVAALQRIARWHGEFPPTGKTWADGTATSYATEYGSNGERDYMRQVALDALSAAWQEVGK